MRIAEPIYRTKHADAISFFNSLIIDLKLQVLGKAAPHREQITMERLEEGTKHIGELMQCKEQVRFR